MSLNFDKFDNFEIKPPLSDFELSLNDLIYETQNNGILDIDFDVSFGESIHNIIDTASTILSDIENNTEIPSEFSSLASSLNDSLSLFEINIDNI